jgi:hypothetical protein
MFHAVIHARPAPMPLAATLGPLVRGVVEGLVGSAMMVTASPSDDIDEIADSAGCRVLVSPDWAEGFARAVAISAGAPLLVVDTGVILGQEFWPVLADSLPMLADRPATTAPPRSSRLSEILTMRAFRRSRVVSRDQVLLLPGSFARALAQSKSDPWLHRFNERLEILPVSTKRVPE